MTSATKTKLPTIERLPVDRAAYEFLPRLIDDPARHAAWLRTLSLLEFTGARKIARSFRRPDDEVLKHLAEEARHARFFATLAERVSREASLPDSSRTLAAGPGLVYFQKLDLVISRDLQTRLAKGPARRACYYHVTAAIEERALDLYGTYNDLLREKETGLRLDGVIAEEEGHLEEMYATLGDLDPDAEASARRYRDVEAGLYDRFRAGIVRALAKD